MNTQLTSTFAVPMSDLSYNGSQQQAQEAATKAQFITIGLPEPRVNIMDAPRLWTVDPTIVFQSGNRLAGTRDNLTSALRTSGYDDNLINDILNKAITYQNHNDPQIPFYREEMANYENSRRAVVNANVSSFGATMSGIASGLNSGFNNIPPQPASYHFASSVPASVPAKGGKGRVGKSFIQKLNERPANKWVNVSNLIPDGSGADYIEIPKSGRSTTYYGATNTLPVVSKDLQHYLLALSLIPGSQQQYVGEINYMKQLFQQPDAALQNLNLFQKQIRKTKAQPVPGYPQPFYGNQGGFQPGVSQFGQPAPQYGQAAPQYGQSAPVTQYGQPAPVTQYGQPAPVAQYGQPAPVAQYGQPAPYQFNPSQNSLQPQVQSSSSPFLAQGFRPTATEAIESVPSGATYTKSQWAAKNAQNYPVVPSSAPPQQYGAPPSPPQQQYNAPPQQYNAPPQQQYNAPPQQYGAPPQQQYGAPPQQQYSAPPQQQYGAPPQQQYSAPPQQQYNAPPSPSQQYGAPPQTVVDQGPFQHVADQGQVSTVISQPMSEAPVQPPQEVEQLQVQEVQQQLEQMSI